MRKFYVLMDFLVFILISCLGGSKASLQILPALTKVEKFVDDKFIVTCQHEKVKADQLSWRSPTGKIPNTKERVHVEPMSDQLSLVFYRIDKKDEGNYTCETVIDGVKQQSYFTLVVIKPISFMNTPRVQNATEKTDTLLRCEVDGDPRPTVTWQIKGKAPEGSKYIKDAKGLFIKNVSVEDAGEYECRAYQLSEMANMEPLRITLRVLHKPVWKYSGSELENTVYGYLGGVVNLTCEVIADPVATFTWKRQSNKINPQNYNATLINEPNRSILQLPIQNMGVYGEYGCEARNNIGHIKRLIELKKGEKPDPPELINVRRMTVNTVSLEVPSESQSGYDTIIGYRVQFVKKLPGIEYTWDSADYQDFKKSDGEYTVQDLLENTTYMFRVASRNVAGYSDYSSSEVEARTLKTSDVTSGAQRHLISYIMIITSIHILFTSH